MKRLILTVLISTYAFSNDCIKNRAAFDIGSGTTKMKVAKIDVCKSQILEILLNAHSPVGYKQDLKLSKNNELSSEIIKQGSKAISELMLKASKYKPDMFIGVATSAFRTSLNGIVAAKKISRSTGLKLKVITQKQEAIIGFRAALPYAKGNIEKLLVWDIGGGSMQITGKNLNERYHVYEGKLAAVSFKNHIIEDVKNLNPQKISSPNPLSLDQMKMAKRDASVVAKITMPASLKDKIKSPQAIIVGIGGVHHFSIAKKVSKKGSYSLDQLESYIKTKLNLNDAQVGGKYASTDVSNLILVAGYMRALGIKSVRAAKVNLSDGILLSPDMISL